MTPEQNEEVAGLLKAGDALIAEKRYAEAAATFQRAVALRPDAVTYSSWGEALAGGRHYAKAIQMYRKAAKLDPAYTPVFYGWAVALAAQEKFDAAAEKWRRVIELRPELAVARYELGRCLANLKRYAEAAEQYAEAAKIDPQDADTFNAWGAALANGGDRRGAIEKYRRATELKPDYALVYNNWGLALAALDEPAQAIEMYRRGADLGVPLHLSWGLALAALGNYAEAIECYRRADEATPNDASVLTSWGAAVANLGDYEQAIEFYRRSTGLDPTVALPFYNWGLSLAALSKYAEAIEQYRRAADLSPNDANIFDSWGASLANLRRYDEAIEQYRHATELNPKSALSFANWALALVNQRKYTEAIVQYKKATEADPKYSGAYLDWGSVLAEQGRYREAIDVTRRITAFDPDYAYAHHNMAYFQWKKGDYKPSWRAWNAAAAAYEKTKEAQRKLRNADFFSNYGSVLHEQLGELRRAEQVLLEGLEIDPHHPDILMRLGSVYTERYRDPERDRDENWATGFWDARDYYDRAERELRRRHETNPDAVSLQKLGDFFLATEDHDEARKHLEKAYALDPANAAICNSLGVACSRLEDYHHAATYYAASLKQNPGDLSVWSNLAETYLKLDRRDHAEKEYRKILTIAADHIDSQVGLGEVYTAMADAGEGELYEVALRHYDRAIELALLRTGSKRVARKELASMYYARGYAAVQAYEAQGALGREALLNTAAKDFSNCVRCDPEHYKGERARRKIVERRKVFSADWFTRKAAPWFIVVPAVAILVEAQIAHFHLASLADIKVGEYSALTFGALMFIVVGLFLPQIQKLKGAGIELEKSPVNQIATSAGLGIKK